MKIKRYQLNNILKVLNEIGDKKLPIQLQYKLLKLKQQAENEQSLQQELIDKNCLQFLEKDENGNPIPQGGGYKIQKEKIEECNKIIAEVMETEIDINDFSITLDELETMDLSFGQAEAFIIFVNE